MTVFALELIDAAAADALGASLGGIVRRGDVLLLSGGLGAGKTTLARGAIRAATGVDGAQSPSFPLVLTYDAPDFTLWHFDLFRLERAGEIAELGWDDAIETGVSLVEWPERLGAAAPADALRLTIDIDGARRRVRIETTPAWERRLVDAGIVRGEPRRS